MEPNKYTKEYPLYLVQPIFRINALCTAGEVLRHVGYASHGEMHDFSECVFVLDGVAEVTAGETVYRLVKGQMIYHPPMEFHRLRNIGEEELRILLFSFSASPCSAPLHRICFFSDAVRITELINNLVSLFNTEYFLLLSPNEKGTVQAIQKAVSRIENYLISLFEQEPDFTEFPEEKGSELYSAAVAVMYQNLHVRLSAREIAQLCGMSVSSMQKLFYKYTGMGMIKYYSNLRMYRARQLLEGGMNVKQTAIDLGYEDQNYFSIVYCKHFGIPPSHSRPFK